MKTKKQMRLKRKLTIRRRLSGTPSRPRMSIFRSNTRLSAQLIDDEKAVTIVSSWVKGKNIAAAVKLGETIVSLTKAKKITSIVFDRSGYRYHGAIKAFAETLRSGGLVF